MITCFNDFKKINLRILRIDGAGNQCCYDEDGNLMFNGDSYQGSSSDRSNPAGLFPYQRPKTVPSVSHMVQDVSPYYYCCLWSSPEYCNMYTELRPTVDCTKYIPPTPGNNLLIVILIYSHFMFC